MLNKRKTKKKPGKPLGDAQFLALPIRLLEVLPIEVFLPMQLNYSLT